MFRCANRTTQALPKQARNNITELAMQRYLTHLKSDDSIITDAALESYYPALKKWWHKPNT